VSNGTILVTGGAGYIGSALVARLLVEDRPVRVLDPLLYGGSALIGIVEAERFELVAADPTDRAVLDHALNGVAAVIHLGAVVGDPACAQHPDLARSLNLDATARLIDVAAARGVQRFVFASTCSVYGAGEELDEGAPLAPKSLYAETKAAGEQIVLSARETSPVVLRFGTIFGDSPRPRFDLVVNLLTAKAFCGEPITIHGGNQWRPFVHVQDVVSAVVLALDAEESLVSGEVFNVGSPGSNLRLADLGELLAACVPGVEITLSGDAIDARDYRANFDKISKRLGFRADWSLKAGVEVMLARFMAGDYGDYRLACHHNDRSLNESESGASAARATLDKITPA
jgi:nucleoside-diphosphate-sugar epimerase